MTKSRSSSCTRVISTCLSFQVQIEVYFDRYAHLKASPSTTWPSPSSTVANPCLACYTHASTPNVYHKGADAGTFSESGTPQAHRLPASYAWPQVLQPIPAPAIRARSRNTGANWRVGTMYALSSVQLWLVTMRRDRYGRTW